jgi:hypothetical protein
VPEVTPGSNQTIEESERENQKLIEKSTTLINKFFGQLIKMDSQMFEGTWRTKKSQKSLVSEEFKGKNEGKLRSFLFRSQREFELFDPILKKKIDEM